MPCLREVLPPHFPFLEVNIMADKTNVKAGYVNVGPFLYDGERYKDPLSVIINGKKYSVPRGKVVSVPAVVAEVLKQSAEQDACARRVDSEAQKTKETNFG